MKRPVKSANASGAARGDASGLVPALERGLSVLELLAGRRKALRAIDIAQELGMPKNSLSRLLQVLMARGYVNCDASDKTFSLTQKLLAIGSATVCENHILEASLDVMRELRDLTMETVQLNALLGSTGVVLDVLPSRQTVRLVVDPGTHFDLHNAAPGKAMLAYLPEKERERILAGLKLTRCTARTITSKGALRREIQEARERGYAVDRGECIDGCLCVSAPIFDRTGACVAALTVTGPSTRMPENRIGTFGPIVLEHADRISRRLGFDRNLAGGWNGANVNGKAHDAEATGKQIGSP
jgi:DNA-binding IclR family transcriptional regulator